MTKRVAFLNAHVIGTANDRDGVANVLIEDGCIKAIDTSGAEAGSDIKTVNCKGIIMMPGLVDMQVRTGEPGNEHEETLKSASQAAVAGGITTMVTQPDTKPVIDDIALVDFITRNASATALNRVHVMGALTKGLEGNELSELHMMHDAGAVAFSNGHQSIKDSGLMRRALSYARDFDGLIVHHVEDPTLTRGAVMNEGEMATRLGLPGMPKEAEIIMLERDVRLAALTGGRYHAATVSCAESVEVIRRAKDRGTHVTCGVSINNLALNEIDIGAYRTFFKLSPPLRTEEDRIALIDGLKDGTIDVVHSDHLPRDVDMKRHPFADAADGAIGLETLLAAMLRLYHDGDLTLSEIARLCAENPARLMGLPGGSLSIGNAADFILIDPDEPWIMDEAAIRSKSKNTPFEGARFSGRVVATYIAGEEVFALKPKSVFHD